MNTNTNPRKFRDSKSREFTLEFEGWAQDQGFTAEETEGLIKSGAGRYDEIYKRAELSACYAAAEDILRTRRAARGPAATSRQIDYLVSLGCDISEAGRFTKAEASARIDQLKARTGSGAERANRVGRILTGTAAQIWDEDMMEELS